MDKIRTQVNTFIELHLGIQDFWFNKLEEEAKEKLNFNRIKVKSYDLDIMKYVYDYRNMLSLYAPFLNTKLNSCGVSRTRIKEMLSMDQKVKNYKLGKLQGEVIFNKCLNDIFGARIIIKNDIDFEMLSQYLRDEFKNKIKLTDADKVVGYKARHVYVRSAPGHFQWEMQIWHECDEKRNIELHEQYKRGYITQLKEWEKQKNGIRT